MSRILNTKFLFSYRITFLGIGCILVSGILLYLTGPSVPELDLNSEAITTITESKHKDPKIELSKKAIEELYTSKRRKLDFYSVSLDLPINMVYTEKSLLPEIWKERFPWIDGVINFGFAAGVDVVRPHHASILTGTFSVNPNLKKSAAISVTISEILQSLTGTPVGLEPPKVISKLTNVHLYVANTKTEKFNVYTVITPDSPIITVFIASESLWQVGDLTGAASVIFTEYLSPIAVPKVDSSK